MKGLRIKTALLTLPMLMIGICHATPEGFSEHLETLQLIFGLGKKITKLYAGRRQPEAELAQILVLPGLAITAVNGTKVKTKTAYWLRGHSAYHHLPGAYELRITSFKRRLSRWPNKRNLGMSTKPQALVSYSVNVTLEAGSKYVVAPRWNSGEMAFVSPSEVCLQGEADNTRYCAQRAPVQGDEFTMDESHGVIVVGQTGYNSAKVILVNLGCDFYTFGFENLPPAPNHTKDATKQNDICVLGIEPTSSNSYTVESVDSGVWKWWGTIGVDGIYRVLDTITFEVEPGKVNYVGHVGVTFDNGKLVGFKLADGYSSLASTLSAGFGDAKIVNKATDY